MKHPIVPTGYQAVMPYLIIKDAAGFIDYAKEVFGATEKSRQMRDENIIVHAQILIGESVIMVSDAIDPCTINNAGIFVYVENADKAYHKAIELGSESLMEPADMPYGRSSGVKDPYGNTWWPTHEI